MKANISIYNMIRKDRVNGAGEVPITIRIDLDNSSKAGKAIFQHLPFNEVQTSPADDVCASIAYVPGGNVDKSIPLWES